MESLCNYIFFFFFFQFNIIFKRFIYKTKIMKLNKKMNESLYNCAIRAKCEIR